MKLVTETLRIRTATSAAPCRRSPSTVDDAASTDSGGESTEKPSPLSSSGSSGECGSSSDSEEAAASIRAPPWAARRRAVSRSEQRGKEEQRLVRAFRSALNKLTVENFDALHEQLATCGISTADHVALLIKEIFEKATEQHHFVALYADLCVRLAGDLRLQAAAPAGAFRRLLLGQCQGAFEALLGPRCAGSFCEEEKERRKRRALGNIKLIGHFLVRGMLNSKLLVECAESLLTAQDCPESLESLAVLLTVAGGTFDGRPEWASAKRFEAVFAKLAELVSDKTVACRVRFLLQDVLDLRRANWRRGASALTQQQGPMRLQEVRRQASGTTAEQQPRRHQPTAEPRAQPTAEPRAAPTAAPPAAPPAVAAPREVPFDPKAFHRELSDTLRTLASDRNVGAAVRKIRAAQVPASHHSREFADILTRAAEERRGPARRCMFAFAAGLMIAEGSAFDRDRCIEGTSIFFNEVYEELSLEVPRLQQIIAAELLPTLRSVAPVQELRGVLPPQLQSF